MLEWDDKISQMCFNCGYFIFIFAHPYLFRFMQKHLGSMVTFIDASGVPTEAGVFVHALVLMLVLYAGTQYFGGEKSGNNVLTNNLLNNLNNANNANNVNDANNLNVINNANEIPKKCRMYCEKISNDLANNANNANNANIVALNNANMVANNAKC